MENREYVVKEGGIDLLVEGKKLAYITFEKEGENLYNITHTVVDSSLRGQGIAGELVKRALAEIERRKGKVKATCSYASGYLEKHASEINPDLLA